MRTLNLFMNFLAGMFLLSIVGCQKQPSASFTASKTNVVTGEAITFTNTSKDASSYKWNFGDGTSSDVASPTHAYENPGTYTVTLTAYSKNGKKSDNATATITVTKANEIRYDGNKYPLTKGYIDYYGDYYGLGNYNFDVYLVDNGITITQSNFFGTGNYLYFEMWSPSSSMLMPGTYTFASNYNSYTFSIGKVKFNYGTTTQTSYYCISGSVTVSQSGSDYIFDITLILENGKTLTAYYKGAVTFYDNSKISMHKEKI
jgi:PKD repeat protein